MKSLGITIDICGSTGLSTVYERRGEPIPNVVRQAWLDLEIFYRSLGEMEDLEMLVLRFKSKEAKQFEDDGKKVRMEGGNVCRFLDWTDWQHYDFSVDTPRGEHYLSKEIAKL